MIYTSGKDRTGCGGHRDRDRQPERGRGRKIVKERGGEREAGRTENSSWHGHERTCTALSQSSKLQLELELELQPGALCLVPGHAVQPRTMQLHILLLLTLMSPLGWLWHPPPAAVLLPFSPLVCLVCLGRMPAIAHKRRLLIRNCHKLCSTTTTTATITSTTTTITSSSRHCNNNNNSSEKLLSS